MAIDLFQTLDVIEIMENFIERKRPPEDIRDKVDLSYRIDDQSVVVFEIRPRWNTPGEWMECPLAKATFIKAKAHWKIFWRRADGKWHSYKPDPTVNSLRDFTGLVEQDKYHCFWG